MKSFNTKNLILMIAMLALAAATFNSCKYEETEPPKSMEDLRKENGIPIEVEEVKLQNFDIELGFFSKMEGYRQATKGASVGGKIEKVNVVVGQSVKEDQILVEFPMDHPGVQYLQAKTALENAEKMEKRFKNLLEAGETSQANYDNIETQYKVSKQNYEAAYQALFIEAPFDGVVTHVNVNQGDGVQGNDPLVTIAQLDRMRTKVWLSDDEIMKVKKGMKARCEWGGKEFRGTVKEVSLAIDPMKQAFYAELIFNNPKRELKSGITTDTYITIYSEENSIVLPSKLIKKEGNKRYVYVLEEEKPKKRYIETGRTSGINVEVISGLKEGDTLITEGLSLISEGDKVQVVNK
jgi:RND family efflux transporter MFP subunit